MADIKMMALLAALAMGASAHAAPVSGQGTWETTLQARDINNDNVVDAWYDTSLDITWLANWNANGQMTWPQAMNWATLLDVYGVSGWRLPTVTDFGNDGCTLGAGAGADCGSNVDPGSSEIAHLYLVTLGNRMQNGAFAGRGLTNTANFLNMQTGAIRYFFGTEVVTLPGLVWSFDLDGFQGFVDKESVARYAVAVRDGDIPDTISVPAPAAGALLSLAVAAAALRRGR